MEKHIIKIGAKDEYQAVSYLQLLLKELKYKIIKIEKLSSTMDRIETKEDKR